MVGSDLVSSRAPSFFPLVDLHATCASSAATPSLRRPRTFWPTSAAVQRPSFPRVRGQSDPGRGRDCELRHRRSEQTRVIATQSSVATDIVAAAHCPFRHDRLDSLRGPRPSFPRPGIDFPRPRSRVPGPRTSFPRRRRSFRRRRNLSPRPSTRRPRSFSTPPTTSEELRPTSTRLLATSEETRPAPKPTSPILGSSSRVLVRAFPDIERASEDRIRCPPRPPPNLRGPGTSFRGRRRSFPCPVFSFRVTGPASSRPGSTATRRFSGRGGPGTSRPCPR